MLVISQANNLGDKRGMDANHVFVAHNALCLDREQTLSWRALDFVVSVAPLGAALRRSAALPTAGPSVSKQNLEGTGRIQSIFKN